MIDAVIDSSGDAARRSVLEALRDPACGSPHRVAIVDGSITLTRDELATAALRLGRQIAQRVAPGSPVALYVRADARFVVGILACVAAGSPFIALDVDDPANYNARVAQHAGAATIIAAAERPPDWDSSMVRAGRLVVDAVMPGGAAGGPALAQVTPLALDAPCALFAVPDAGADVRIIAHSQRSLLHSAEAFVEALDIDACDRILGSAPPATFAAARDVFAALASGGMYVTNPAPDDPYAAAELLHAQHATVLCGSLTLLRALAGLDPQLAGSALRDARVDDDAIDDAELGFLRARLPPRCRISIQFGSTESGTLTHGFLPLQSSVSGLAIGKPLRGTQIAAVNAAGELVAGGEIGRLRARGPQVALGVWRDGALTTPFAGGYAGAEMIRVDSGGLLCMAGRSDRTRSVWGRRVDLGHIEAALRACRGVSAATVMALAAHGVDRLTAFVVRNADPSPASRASVRSELATRLPAHAVPGDVRFVDALAFEAGGADEAALAMLAAVPNPRRFFRVHHAHARPDESSRTIAQSWSDVLGIDSLLADERWADGGGDPMRARALHGLLERRLGRSIEAQVVRADTRPSTLIASLARSAHAAADERRVVVLLPGLPGQNEKFDGFCAHFARDCRVVAPTYLPWHAIARCDSLVPFIDDIVGQVVPHLGATPVVLVGHSFGGLIAHELARHLAEREYAVGLVGILDTDITFGPSPPAEEELVNRTRSGSLVRDVRAHGVRRALGHRIAHRLSYRVYRARRLRALLGRFRSRWWLPPEIAVPFEAKLNVLMREEIARAWIPRQHAVPTIVFRCRQQTTASVPYDLGWSAYARAVDIADAGGTHHSMIAGAHGRRLAQRLAAAMAALPR